MTVCFDGDMDSENKQDFKKREKAQRLKNHKAIF